MKFAHPAKRRICGQGFEGIASGFDNPRSRVRIIAGNEFPNCPQFILDARRQDEFSHALP